MSLRTLSAALIGLAQAPSMWGGLEPGPYAVGVRELLLHDAARPSLQTEDGALVSGESGRQMQIVVWYPAQPIAGPSLTFEFYVERQVRELDFRPLDESMRSAAREMFRAQAAGLGGDSSLLRAGLAELYALPVAARLDARSAPGRFPLLLFPAYRTPATNSILAEYLASHGYVIASTSLKGSHDAQVEYWTTRGLETLAADLQFVIAALDTIPFVESDQLGTLGVGIAASGALALQMRNPAVAAFASLEGGITTEGEMALLRRSPFFDVSAVRAPMLAITAPHPSVDPERLELYRYATRHLVHFPAMGEFWFLNFGMLESNVPGIIGPPPGDTRAGFEAAARHVRRFFDAYLRADIEARTQLLQDSGQSGLYTARTRPALPAPPTISEVKRMILTDGINALLTLVDTRIAADPEPIPPEHFVALRAWLANGHDPSGTMRSQLEQLRLRLHPRSQEAR
jgi:hypothetical protein